jgi:ribokinase
MASSPAMRVAVVGHVEWCEFAEVPHVPAPGEIVHAASTFEEPAGGGAVAAVQLKKLAGSATLFTAFGDDEVGGRASAGLAEQGVHIEAGFRPETQRRAFVHLDEPGERTITVLGARLGPLGADPLDWSILDSTDAVYVTAGDVEAVRQARRARTLVATPRGLETLADAHVELDALVASGRDPGELYRPGDLDPTPRVVVRTAGAAGGEWETQSGERGRWGPAPLPGPVRDSYGCGDSFAAGLTHGLGAGWDIGKAVELAARCGAACLTGRGPYEAQLTL